MKFPLKISLPTEDPKVTLLFEKTVPGLNLDYAMNRVLRQWPDATVAHVIHDEVQIKQGASA